MYSSRTMLSGPGADDNRTHGTRRRVARRAPPDRAAKCAVRLGARAGHCPRGRDGGRRGRRGGAARDGGPRLQTRRWDRHPHGLGPPGPGDAGRGGPHRTPAGGTAAVPDHRLAGDRRGHLRHARQRATGRLRHRGVRRLQRRRAQPVPQPGHSRGGGHDAGRNRDVRRHAAAIPRPVHRAVRDRAGSGRRTRPPGPATTAPRLRGPTAPCDGGARGRDPARPGR
jgi:hypothetical protein